jgi:hypothetical protein
MAQEPDRIRDEIEMTRGDLTRNVDALADRTVPTRVARRRWNSVKERVRGVSDRVMGTPGGTGYSARNATRFTGSNTQGAVRSAAGTVQDAAARAGDKAGEIAGNVSDSVRQAPRAVAEQTQGNPIAAGVVAFGVGLLAASLIPTTAAEQRAAQQLKDSAGDLVDEVRQPLAESAGQLKEDLSGSVREAADRVKETARDAAETTKEQAKSSARDTAAQTKQAAREAT